MKQRQHLANCQLGDGWGRRVGGVGHLNMSGPSGREVNLVEADAKSCDQAEVRCPAHHPIRDCLTARDQRVEATDHLGQFLFRWSAPERVKHIVRTRGLKHRERGRIGLPEGHAGDQDAPPILTVHHFLKREMPRMCRTRRGGDRD